MSSNNAVAAKIRAMYGECLKEEDYRNLTDRETVGEICSYLKNKGSYSRFFKDLNENDVHRGEMENLLWKEISDEYKRMLSFVDSSQGEVLKFWFLRKEVDYLKHGLRKIYNHESKPHTFESTEELDGFFRSHTAIDMDLIKNADNLEDFIRGTEGTVYHDILKRAQGVGTDYFHLAMTLDGLYYKHLWQAVGKYLSGTERAEMEHLLGSDADMRNIIWIYRGKKYFNFDNKIIYTYILPIRHKLKDDILKEMIECQDVESLVNLVENTPYNNLFQGIGEGYFIEENYRKEMYKIYKKIFRTYPYTLADLFAYLGLKEFEILNITQIVEGVRYNLNPETIKKHILTGGTV